MTAITIILFIAAVLAFYILYNLKQGKTLFCSKQVFPSNSIVVEKITRFGNEAEVGDTGFSMLLKSKTLVFFYLDSYKAGDGPFASVENEIKADHLRENDKCLIKVLAKGKDSYIVSYPTTNSSWTRRITSRLKLFLGFPNGM